MTLDFRHTPADVVRWLLVQLGLGTDPNLNPLQTWPAYNDVEPSTPDNVITTGDTVGMDDGRSMVDGSLDSHYGFQVRVRGVDKPTAVVKALSIRRRMAEGVSGNLVVPPGSSAKYLVHCISKIGQVLPLGFERGTRRNLATINALVALTVLQ